eukprot:TRINITY_DN4553_c0_g1_i3.p1 TRINITY_DN4553_c0_g1~~TRINITY_DN4553_c0_g1_i3.p1  ORF type:complete len:342 (+),score=60.68 TRINITY_DN4553_c0_g1_i3:285-1310(+)
MQSDDVQLPTELEEVKMLYRMVNEEKEIVRQERELLEYQREALDEMFKKVSSVHISGPITLNIGGKKFSTTLDTLQRYRDSFFGALFSGLIALRPEKDGTFFIDRDGTHFNYILNYLRTGELVVPTEFPHIVKMLLLEAEFYQIESLIVLLGGEKPSEPEFFAESTILPHDKSHLSEILNEWVGAPKDQKWKLIYKGTRDGFQGSTFHALADNKGSTYTLVKSNRNIFGGYNPLSWTSNRGYTNGIDSFLFSLVNLYETPAIKLVNNNTQFGACNHPDFLPTFGRPGNLDLYDLRLSEECNNSKNSHCCFDSYTNPTDKGSRLFTGRPFFKVDEIEVFVRM